MKITLDEHGVCLPDAQVEAWVDEKMTSAADIHISNQFVLDCIRAKLVKQPIESRPQITWVVYGKEVHFDDDLRSHDAWQDERINLWDKFLMTLFEGLSK